MPRTRIKVVQMIVNIVVPQRLGHREALAEVRSATRDGLAAWGRADVHLLSVAPIPSDRIIKKRRAPTKRERALLLEIMEGKMS